MVKGDGGVGMVRGGEGGVGMVRGGEGGSWDGEGRVELEL